MRAVDLIHKKRLGGHLTKAEIGYLVDAYVAGQILDYQMSAWLMAVLFQGMDHEETNALTFAMAESGEQLDWSAIPGVKVDKHSTGGVGDTASLVLAPLVAAAGAPVVKMSGRGLGHTGGTIDKLESIPGFQTTLSPDALQSQVRTIGVAIAGQTANLAPADKKLYALRDVTDTVASIPLIASSIMSKKLASGADGIVLDVKVGDGAFMKTMGDATRLAEAMVRIGQAAGRRVVAVLTSMDEPLGHAVGNALEVKEAIDTLRGQGPEDLRALCLAIGSRMLVLANRATSVEEATVLLEERIASGAALDKMRELVEAQGGDPTVIDQPDRLPTSPVVRVWGAPMSGVIHRIHAEAFGVIAMRLGAGRDKAGDAIEPSVGLVLRHKVGQRIAAGEPLVDVHAMTEEAAAEAMQALADVFVISEGEPFKPDWILGVVGDDMASMSRNQSAERSDLLDKARHARQNSYAPYSKFRVGAAIRLSNGEVVEGCNVENASYGLTSCAERNAVFSAMSQGYLSRGIHITEVAVVADSPEPVAPCGACRQVLAEFCQPNATIVLGNTAGETVELTIENMLPYAFSSRQMETEGREELD